MCVLSIKVPIRDKSGNLFNDPRIYIYIYIYIGGAWGIYICIYIYVLLSTDWLFRCVTLFSEARYTRCFQVRSIPWWLYASRISYHQVIINVSVSESIPSICIIFSFVYIYTVYSHRSLSSLENLWITPWQLVVPSREYSTPRSKAYIYIYIYVYKIP